MCGRYVILCPFRQIVEAFSIIRISPQLELGFKPRFNVAPTQEVPVITGAAGGRAIEGMRWGLIPPWAPDASVGSRMLNARCETVLEKPVFRGPMGRRRCVLPATGFYEWSGKGKVKTPHLFSRRDGEVFGFAGLWESWHGGPGGVEVRSCTLITTSANELVGPVHHRMPVMLDRDGADAWLAPEGTVEALVGYLKPFPAGGMNERVVSRRVNSAGAEGEGLLLADEPSGLFE